MREGESIGNVLFGSARDALIALHECKGRTDLLNRGPRAQPDFGLRIQHAKLMPATEKSLEHLRKKARGEDVEWTREPRSEPGQCTTTYTHRSYMHARDVHTIRRLSLIEHVCICTCCLCLYACLCLCACAM